MGTRSISPSCGRELERLSNDGDKCAHCGERSAAAHGNDYFEIAHITTQPLTCDASPEDPAMMVEVAYASLTNGTMVDMLLLSLAPDEATNAECSTISVVDVPQPLWHGLTLEQTFSNLSRRDGRAPCLAAAECAWVAKHQAQQAQQRYHGLYADNEMKDLLDRRRIET